MTTPTLDQLVTHGAIGPLDRHFAEAVCRIGGVDDEAVRATAAFASRAVGAGHVCLDLAKYAGEALLDAEGVPVDGATWPELSVWREALITSKIARSFEDLDTTAPLVLEGERLYLQRYFAYEVTLADELARRAAAARDDVDDECLREGIERLFPPGDVQPDLQKVAAAAAVMRGLAVVSGGPGTGKTTTVVKILALLQEQAIAARRRPLDIALVAPTGKAAAQLTAAIEAGKQKLPLTDEVRDAIDAQASTIHRRLGIHPQRPTRPRHHADNPLGADVVVVDEASMVPLALMAKLVEAVPPRARLILLGDRDQLASVEAGAILGDICAVGTARPDWSEAGALRLAAVTGESLPSSDTAPPIADCVTHLSHSYRFDPAGGIGGLARAINRGDTDAALELLGDPDGAVRLVQATGAAGAVREITERAVEGYRAYVQARAPRAALEALGAYRVLTAHRSGPLGVDALNRSIRLSIAREGLIDENQDWYPGRPVMVRQNDYTLRLYNGDVGVTLHDAEADRLRVWFADGEQAGGVRAVPPARLPSHESVFAMTVHKSQGSEFDHVLVVLPQATSRILTRELLYTAVTRARSGVTIVGDPEVVRAAVERRVERASGLRRRLWVTS